MSPNSIPDAVEDVSSPTERALFDAMPQLGWLARPDGYITFYNRGWFEFTGTTHSEMEGWGWKSVHDPKLLPSVEASWRNSIETGACFELAFPLRRHDGVFKWFLTRVNPQRDLSGRIVRWVGINTDIDAQKQGEQRLALQLERELESRRAAEAFSEELGAQSREVAVALKRASVRIAELEEQLLARR